MVKRIRISTDKVIVTPNSNMWGIFYYEKNTYNRV